MSSSNLRFGNSRHLLQYITAGLFVTYIILAIVLALNHEPWFDEAQFWLHGRDASGPWELILQNMRYEGTPALWPLILMLLSKLGMSYYLYNVISVCFGIIAVYMILYKSPFPFIIKVLLPFTYYIFYQYAVIARSYVLILPILLIIANIYKNKTEKTYLYTFLLVLLSMVSLHSFMMSGCLAFVYLIDIIKARRQTDKIILKKQIIAIICFTLWMLFTISTLILPNDLEISFIDGYKLNTNLNEIISEARTSITNSLIANGREKEIFRLPIEIYSLCFLIMVCYIGRKTKTLLVYILPAIALLFFLGAKYAAPWHRGLLFPLLIFALWIIYDEIDKYKISNIMRKLLLYMLVPILLIQIKWSINTYIYDYNNNYSGSREVAEYIKELKEKKEDITIFGTSHLSIAIQPYFDKNIFINYNDGKPDRAYLWLSTNNNFKNSISYVIDINPDVIILYNRIYKQH